MPTIELRTKIRAPKERVFDLARSVDLHKISTQQTNEEAIDGITSGLLGLDEWVTWRAKHFGVYQKLTSKITAFDRPNYFTDEMMQGAFKSFTHEHLFYESQNSTEMVDVFEYKAPYGFLGKLADKLFLKKYMTVLLEKRNMSIRDYAESQKWKKIILNER